MKVSYHVPEGGEIHLAILDESNARLRDTDALTGTYQQDRVIDNWQDGPIDAWVGKIIQVQFHLQGGAQVFGFSFDDISSPGSDTASIGSSDDRFVLPPRHNYVMAQNPPFVKSVENTGPFKARDKRLQNVRTGYQLQDPTRSGHVLTSKLSLPGTEMKVSCDPGQGSIVVSLFDESGTLLASSKPLRDTTKIRQLLEWKGGFTLNGHISKPVTLRFELTGGAKIYGLHFDQVFWE